MTPPPPPPSPSIYISPAHLTTSHSRPQSSTPTWAHVLAHEDLPPPGPDHFAARRALWTTPTAASRLGQAPSTSCVRLENLLDEPGALERPDVWDAGLDRVWKGLIGGGRLKNFLPLRAVVKILYAGWRRDGTWPDSAAVVDGDDFFGTTESHSKSELLMDNVTPLTVSDTSSLVGRNSPSLKPSPPRYIAWLP